MKKIILVAFICSFLGACGAAENQQPIPIEIPKPVVVDVPSKLLNCPRAVLPKDFQDNKEVAQEIVRLYNDNGICHHNALAVKKFLDEAKNKIESK